MKQVLTASIALAIAILSSSAHAQFNYQTSDDKYTPGDLCQANWTALQTKITRIENQLSFRNSGGPMNIGVCWWHSRMQRNANYLLQFSPTGRKVQHDEGLQIVKGLTRSDRVQQVSGYTNLHQFSADYYRDMTEALGQWQMSESFLQFGWVHGMGSNSLDPSELKSKMDDLFVRVNNKKEVPFTMLKLTGFEAHGWLIDGMKKTPNGYLINIIDSNSGNNAVMYSNGSAQLPYYGGLVPYVQHDDDLTDYQQAIASSCSGHGKRAAISPRR